MIDYITTIGLLAGTLSIVAILPQVWKTYITKHSKDLSMKILMTFINMDGYGYYVWPAFSLTIVILLIMAIVSFLKFKANESALNKVSERKNKTQKEIKYETQE